MISRPSCASEHSAPHDTQEATTQLPVVSIGGQVINFISAERLVNASNLVKAAGIDRRKLQKILIDCKITDTKRVAGYGSVQGTYISYRDGLKICRHIKLEDDLLRSIAGNVEETAQETVDIHYQPTIPSILIHGQVVYYRPAEKLINATNLLQAARIHRTDLRKILGECGVTNITPLRGKGSVQGSYVTYRDGLKTCKHLGLDHGPLQQVLKEAGEVMDPGDVADTHPETATPPMRIRGRVVYRSKEFINASHLLAIVGNRHVSRTLNGWGIPFVKNITGGPRGTYVSYRNGKRICQLLQLQEDCIEEGQRDDLLSGTVQYVYIRFTLVSTVDKTLGGIVNGKCSLRSIMKRTASKMGMKTGTELEMTKGCSRKRYSRIKVQAP